MACFYFVHPLKSIDRIVEKQADMNLFGFFMMPNYYKLLEMTGLGSERARISVSNHYGITGLYSGLVGSALIDFGWLGPAFIVILGFFAGRILRSCVLYEAQPSLLFILGPIVPALIITAPIINMVSLAQFQSMIA